MSDHAHPHGHDHHHHDHGHGHDHHGQAGSFEHAGVKFYIGVAVVLTIVTVIELYIINVPMDYNLLLLTLFGLSILKFAGVVMFFMHLFFDNKILTACFVSGLLVALGTIWALSYLVPPYKGFQAVLYHPTHVEKPDPARGLVVFKTKGCAGCHTIAYVSTASTKALCPDLTYIRDVAFERMGADPEGYIRAAIVEPNAYIPEGYLGVMPDLRPTMTAQEYEDLVAYLMTLQRDKAGATPTPSAPH